MSLDVYLNTEKIEVICKCQDCGDEHKRQLSNCVFSSNITHNLGEMAEAVGLYEYLWRVDEIPVTKAKELIIPLKVGLKKLSKGFEKYQKFNPKNGWGSYENLVDFVVEYLKACETYPEATIEISR